MTATMKYDVFLKDESYEKVVAEVTNTRSKLKAFLKRYIISTIRHSYLPAER
jgi:hypothetical protein